MATNTLAVPFLHFPEAYPWVIEYDPANQLAIWCYGSALQSTPGRLRCLSLQTGSKPFTSRETEPEICLNHFRKDSQV